MAESKESSSSAEDNAGPGSFDLESWEVVNSIDPQDQSPLEQNSECTLQASGIRIKENEKLSESVTITSFTRKTGGTYLIKLADNKTYHLPFALSTNFTQPDVKIVKGIQYIKYESVLYTVTKSTSGSPNLKNQKTGEYCQLHEVYSTGDGREESIERNCGSSNEFRQTLGSRIEELSVMGGTLDKSKTCAGVSPDVNTIQKLEGETKLTPDFSQTRLGDPEQRFNNNLSGGEITEISIEQREKTGGKHEDQTCLGELNESNGRYRKPILSEGKEKTPNRETLVKDSHQKDGREIDPQPGVNNGDSEGESDNIPGQTVTMEENLSYEAANITDENKTDQQSSGAHSDQAQERHAASTSTDIMVSTHGEGKSPTELKAVEEGDHAEAVERSSYENKGRWDSGDHGSKETMAVEARAGTSEKVTGLEGSNKIKEHVKETSKSPATLEIISENTQVLKLWIKYFKKQGKKTEADVSKHLVSCCLNFHQMWNFYTQTDCGRKMLDVIAGKHHCKVSLPADEHMKEFFTIQVSESNFQDESDVKNFIDCMVDEVYVSAQESLSVDLIGVDPKILEDFQEKIKERKELDCSWIELIGEGNPVTVCTVCHKDHQQLVMQIITELITDATKSFNNHKEMVTVDFMWQSVMTKYEYLKEIGLKFPSTEIINDKNLNAFLLKGPRDEVKAAAGHLEELIKMAHKEVHEEVFSPGYQFEIFASSEMCDYIDNSLPKLPVVWIPNHVTKEIYLFSRDSKELKGIDKSIKGCIEERFYPLSKDCSSLPLEKLDSVQKLKMKHKGKIVIHLSESPTGLCVTTADDIFKGVDAAVMEIIRSEIDAVHLETCVPEKPDGRDGQLRCKPQLSATDPDKEKKDLFSEKVSDSGEKITKSLEVKDENLFRKLSKEIEKKINQIAKEHCVRIEESVTQSRFGFVLKGLEKEVQHIFEIIREEEKQIQRQDISDVAGAGEKVHKQMTPGPNVAGKSKGSKLPAKAEEPGLEQREWSYPNGKKITLLKAASCDAEVIIIPGDSDKVGTLGTPMKDDGRIFVPLWKGGTVQEKHKLHEEIKRILLKVSSKDIRSVGFCITPVRSWSFEHYLKCFLYQIDQFHSGKAGGCLVQCLVLFTEHGDCYKTAYDIMKQFFKDQASIIPSEPQELKNVFTSPREEKEPLFKKIKVSIQRGLLHNVQAEVLVNTISQDLELSKGVISASLLKKAGQGLQREIKKKDISSVPYGLVIKTSSGNLPPPCKTVLHGVLQQYNPSNDSVSTFNQLLETCLEWASKYQSIAFPAIGTGKLGYPKDLVTCLMLAAVLRFEQAHPHTNLKEVKFVIHPDDNETHQQFLSQLYSLQAGPGKQTAAEQPEMMIVDQYVSKTLDYGEVKVQAKLGAIETEATDCLMVFYEKGWLFKDETKVLSLAGNSVRRKWIDHRGYGNFNNGLILVTDGGNLRYTKIIHVACDINTINKAAIDGLQKADSEKMKTIVIPFIQKDPLLRDLRKYCTEILKAVKELATSFSLVNSVMFVIQGLSNFPDFNAIFETESKNVGIGKIIESNKANDPLFNQGKSVKPTASFPSEPKEQQIPRDEKRVDPETVQQSMKGYEVSLAGGKCQLVHTSRERCCIIVSGDIKSREDLKKRFSSYNHDSNKLKYVVYPYENKSALVIFEKEVDITTVDLGTDVLKVEPLPPQLLQELEFLLPNAVVERADSKGQMEKMFTNLKETCGIEVSDQGKQVYLVGITACQMDIAKNCLEEFCEARLNIKVKKLSKSLSSSSLDEDSYGNYDILRKVSEVEFKALKIIENGFEKINAKIAWNDDAVMIFGIPSYTSFVVKELNSRLGSLRNKQLEEISLDEEEKKVVEHVIEEVQSKDTICVLEEIKGQVVVYADKQDDIMKFKHKLKLKTGRVKESGRSRKRFAESIQSMESSRGNFSSSVRSTETNEEFSWSKDASDVEVFYTKENIKVVVYKANILNLPVDCIVNAANDSLQHGGGVAKVIADAAGPLLVQEGDAIIRQMGNVPVGCQVTTTAGRLRYKCVIHTVGPRWSDYNPRNFQKVKDCEEDLYRAIYGCFLEAEKNGVSMIALPAVSSGIYAVPQDMCAVQYAKAVLDYSRKSVPGKSLTEIHFVDRIPHLVKLMQDTFRTMIQKEKVPNYNIQNYVTSSSYQEQELKEAGRKGHGKQDLAANNSLYETAKYKEFTPIYYESDVHHKKYFEFQVSAKPVVHIYEGNILKLKNLNAVVCPDDSKGTGIGMIASELLKKPKYKDLKEKSFKGKKHNLGDVVITYGQDNPFNVIVHVVIENSSPKKPEFKSTVKMCMDNILRKTNEWVHVKTIALPLFGVKEGLLTEKSWAELFLERFLAFCHEVKNPNLEEVHIIVYYSQGVFSTLKKVFRDFADQMNKPQSQNQLTPPKQPLSNFHKMATDDAQDPMSNRGNGSKNDKGEEGDSCTICMCSKTDPKTLSCGHSFCSECIDEMFRHKPVCPICGKIVGTLTGDQPKDGTMKVRTSLLDLAGYIGHGSIEITYDFPAGRQGPNHPSPGTWYGSLMRTAYLPNTPEGTKVYRMLKLAFDRGLVFTISQSRTTGKEGLTWNDIHHKTNPKPGTQFGYPDPEYLSRVKDELAAKGITEADIQPETA